MRRRHRTMRRRTRRRVRRRRRIRRRRLLLLGGAIVLGGAYAGYKLSKRDTDQIEQASGSDRHDSYECGNSSADSTRT